VQIRFDAAKDEAKLAKRGVILSDAEDFEWEDAHYKEDSRQDYGEKRIIGTGYIGVRLYVAIIIEREGVLRIISLRKANARERKKYQTNE
jgi:uncharacterized DUF497 family protein